MHSVVREVLPHGCLTFLPKYRHPAPLLRANGERFSSLYTTAKFVRFNSPGELANVVPYNPISNGQKHRPNFFTGRALLAARV